MFVDDSDGSEPHQIVKKKSKSKNPMVQGVSTEIKSLHWIQYQLYQVSA